MSSLQGLIQRVLYDGLVDILQEVNYFTYKKEKNFRIGKHIIMQVRYIDRPHELLVLQTQNSSKSYFGSESDCEDMTT